MKKKTHEEYVIELAETRSSYIVLGTYSNSYTKILHKHLVCGYEWEVSPNHILRGTSCAKCAGNIKKTHEEYVLELLKKHPEYIALGTYSNSYTKILHKHLVCGYEWGTPPHNVLKGVGCPECSGKIKKTQEEYVLELAEKKPNYNVLGYYTNNYTKILHKHLVCGYEWETAPTNILRGIGCPKCSNYGYNPAQPGTIYLLLITSPQSSFFKIGISNNPEQRHKKIVSSLPKGYSLKVWEQVEYKDGSIPFSKERLILNKYIKYNDLEKFDGSTELLSFDNCYTEIVADMLQQ